MFKILAVLASGLALVQAYTAPTTQSSGNAIYTPSLNEVVPVGAPFTITWDPTGFSGDIALVLLQGPSTNILPLYAVADGIANTGSFSWTPSSDLEPTGDSGYGFQIIDNATGEFQWSTQFGISNPNYGTTPTTSSTPAPPPTSSAAPPPSGTGKAPPPPPSGSGKLPPPPPPSGSWPQPSGGAWPSPPSGGSKPYYPDSNCTTLTSSTTTVAKATGKTVSTSTSYVSPPKATGYTGPVSNNAGRFAVNAAVALIAVGAAALFL